MGNLTLAIMAAGMGSRYGGSKQIDKFGANGEILMEYSIYDAVRAGFDRVVVILKEEMLDTFKEIAGDKIAQKVKIDYVFQRMSDVPAWFTIPDGRVKPWGTGQAASALDGVVNEPFCIINADDFYGAESYKLIADFLSSAKQGTPYQCCMAGYGVENTLSENGTVTRGVCDVNGTKLVKLVERFKILRRDDGIIIDEDSGIEIPEKTSVSMNMFGFQAPVIGLLKDRFSAWLKANEDLLKGEYLLPTEVCNMVSDNLLTVDVLPTSAKWNGVTYQEDKAPLVERIKELTATGVYPKNLWG